MGKKSSYLNNVKKVYEDQSYYKKPENWERLEIQSAIDNTDWECEHNMNVVAGIVDSGVCSDFVIKNPNPIMIVEQYPIEEYILHKADMSLKTAVLNFANFTVPGGGYTGGTVVGQEEALCMNTTLYPVLKSFKDDFYEVHKKIVNHGLYMSDMLYSPGIRFKDNEDISIDVITAAAPFARQALQEGIDQRIINDTIFDRLRLIFIIAAMHQVDRLIIGAYGCGTFGNDTEWVATCVKKLTDRYGKFFKEVVNPIPDWKTYNAFLSVSKKEEYYVPRRDVAGSIINN